jgi:hypothetical protein
VTSGTGSSATRGRATRSRGRRTTSLVWLLPMLLLVAGCAEASDHPDETAEVGERDEEVSVLVLGGSSDWNVLPEQVEAWQPVLDADDRLEILPGITHALTRLDEDDPAAITPADVGAQVEPVVLDTIAAWLDATLPAAPSD